MQLNLVTIKDLHGYININIQIRDSLSLLVGINGAGKTSTLNAINWMLNLDLASLGTESFESIEIGFNFESDDYLMKATQETDQLIVELIRNGGEHQFNPIITPLTSNPKNIGKFASRKGREFANLSQLEPEEDEEETWNFILNLSKPMIIGLDRTLYTSIRNRQASIDFTDYVNNETLLTRQSSPLQIVSKLLRDQYSIANSKLLKLNRLLNETILLSSFDTIYTKEKAFEVLESPVPNFEDLLSLEDKVIQFLKDNNRNSDHELSVDSENSTYLHERKIRRYFSGLRNIFKNRRNTDDGYDLAYLMNITQVNKVNKLADAFSDFEKDTQMEIEPLDEFMAVINGFFKDSAKQLYFLKERNVLRFNVIDKKGNIIKKGLNINSLSSGEKQILILLTYIKFREETLFLIDEPELSLHIKWQEDFLNAIQTIKRPGTQLLIATHSPEIIGNYRANCEILNPYK